MSATSSICVVDDDAIYHLTFKLMMSSIGGNYTTHYFTNGAEAMMFLEGKINDDETLPDVIFLDINMPIMDGWEFMEAYIQIKHYIGKKILIYMVSSSVYAEDIQRAKAISEISDYIIKPITREQLSFILNNLENQ